MKKILIFLIPLVLFGAFIGYSAFSSNSPAIAQYVKPAQFRQWLSTNQAMIIDVQSYPDFLKQHFPGSIPTYAYPVVTPEQKKRVAALIPAIKKSGKPVVLVCPGGITGAPNARRFLVSQGVSNKKLFILQGGTWGWPWRNMMVSGG